MGSLKSQATGQTQLIAQLKRVISIHSGVTATIQATGTLNISAGENLKLNGSTMGLKACIIKVHGLFKADTMKATTISAQT